MLFLTPTFIPKDAMGDSEIDKFTSLFLNQEADIIFIYAFIREEKEVTRKSYEGQDTLTATRICTTVPVLLQFSVVLVMHMNSRNPWKSFEIYY